MIHFWESDIWSWILLFAVLTGSLLVGNTLRRKIPLLRNSLIPTSVLGGAVLLIVAAVYKLITGDIMFDTAAFGGNGTRNLEVITYHALALGFIASSLKINEKNLNKKRADEIFNTGVTTVSTYLLQGVFGMAITIIAACTVMPGFFKAAGLILPFGYGQGTGQAMNYGSIYEALTDVPAFTGGTAFGLTIAALGFISSALGGVVHLNIRKKSGKLKKSARTDGSNPVEAVGFPTRFPCRRASIR